MNLPHVVSCEVLMSCFEKGLSVDLLCIRVRLPWFRVGGSPEELTFQDEILKSELKFKDHVKCSLLPQFKLQF